MGDLFRTLEGAKKYRDYRARGILEQHCVLCAKSPVQTFTYWKIVTNDFPYDRIAQTHEMIVPIRHVTESELTQAEFDELLQIKETELQRYDYTIEAMQNKKTIPQHFHLHLIVGKEIEIA